MSGEFATRDFLFPTIGIVVPFVALGPAIGGRLFVPLAVAFKSPTAFATLLGAFIASGVVTGFVCALAASLAGLTAGTSLARKASADPPRGG